MLWGIRTKLWGIRTKERELEICCGVLELRRGFL